MKKSIKGISKLVLSFLIVGTTFTDYSYASKVSDTSKTIANSSISIESNYSNKFFKATRVENNIFRIAGVNGELMYLIEGENKVALIDTGTGVGNLKEFVEKITKKPIAVILTHGHVDHAPGASMFNDIYMSYDDKNLYGQHDTLETRKDFTSISYKDSKKLNDLDYVPVKASDNFNNLKDGDVFNLGGVTLEAISVPGHTQGMTAILIKEQRVLITGDACNFSTFLFDENTTGLTTYQNSMKNLLDKTNGKFDKIYISHMSGDAPKSLIADMITLIDEIKAGKADNIPFEFMGHKAFIAKKTNENFLRIDGGTANLIYDLKRINE